MAPNLVVIAGPNGSGKTTSAPALLPGYLGIEEFVNADAIAHGLSAFRPETVALKAGRMMLRRLQELADQRASFAFETTLATRSFAPWLSSLRDRGYRIHLLFLWLRSPEFAIARVATRVRDGGHGIPEDVIRRRYDRGLRNFFSLYRHIARSWKMLDNSRDDGAQPIAVQHTNGTIRVLDQDRWDEIRKGYE